MKRKALRIMAGLIAEKRIAITLSLRTYPKNTIIPVLGAASCPCGL